MRKRKAQEIASGRGLAAGLREQRRLLRLSLRQMAERAKIPPGRLCEYEGGSRRFPSARTLAVLAVAYELPRNKVLALHFARRLRATEQLLANARADLIAALLFGGLP